ncbi:hypothetical protein [Paenibacillus wynnii]|uniref:hypothetical protein n=1 Tax=Paenibacillus wynnii TaxID=268407 RepID=UPI002792DE28|nr:hypothetical protein [Paenibacillus wynnii]MDQ0193289.1 nucleoside 2-deoxyribosyltransferase [Paenibacillus wynnii]
MRIYLGIKYVEDFSNRSLIESILSLLESYGHETYCVVRDMEEWGMYQYPPEQLMKTTFQEIAKADILLIEFSEKGVGLGIEAGYAYANLKPIIVVAKEGADISATIKGTSTQIITYKIIEDLEKQLIGKTLEESVAN